MSETETKDWVATVPVDVDRFYERLHDRSPDGVIDEGYQLHCGLREVFGELGPQPFRARPYGTLGGIVEGYTTGDAERLAETASRGLQSDSEWRRILRVESMTFRPVNWPEKGTEVNYVLDCVPVVRRQKADERGEVRVVEEDAYRAAVGAERTTRIRSDVYREWLAKRLDGAARVLSFSLDRFAIKKLERFDSSGKRRKRRVLTRPWATLSGRLRVVDPARFRERVLNGVGKHAAFGAGMMVF